jgi:hypothetical protein
MRPDCPPGSGSCPTWNIEAEDRTTGQKTNLLKTTSAGQTWNWAFGAALEAHYVIQCSDYPANNGVSLTVKLYDENLDLISDPGWSEDPAPSNTEPYCAYTLSSTSTRETLKYSPKSLTSVNVSGTTLASAIEPQSARSHPCVGRPHFGLPLVRARGRFRVPAPAQ